MSCFGMKVSQLHDLSFKKFRNLEKSESIKLEALVNDLSTNESKFEKLVNIIFCSFEKQRIAKTEKICEI